jgi:hypothetical protein
MRENVAHMQLLHIEMRNGDQPETVGGIAHSCRAAYQVVSEWYFGPGGANLWISEVNGTDAFSACVFLR